MTLKRNISFSLNARKGKTDNLPIRMRITYKGARIDIPLGYNVDESNWNAKTQKVVANSVNRHNQTAMEINKQILEAQDKVDKLFRRYDLDDAQPTPKEVKEACMAQFSKRVGGYDVIEDMTIGFFDRFDEFVKDKGSANNWTTATHTKFKAVRSHLFNFDPNLGVDDFDEQKLSLYLRFLQVAKKMRNTTIEKQLGFLKWFLRWLDSKGYASQKSYLIFRPKIKSSEKKIIFLDWDELMHLYSFEIPQSKQYLERVRDVFCFCCFTSLRYSDVYNLKRSDVKEDRIEITTIKTNDNLTIELNDYSRAILCKYKDIPFAKDKALPVISNQKMNEYLKELGELVGMDEPIKEVYFVGNERRETVLPKYALLGTHAGRRTFICNMLALNISPQVVMEWTGHSDYKAMKPYIAVTEKTRAKAMEVFNRK